jgi:hypothetical protein
MSQPKSSLPSGTRFLFITISRYPNWKDKAPSALLDAQLTISVSCKQNKRCCVNVIIRRTVVNNIEDVLSLSRGCAHSVPRHAGVGDISQPHHASSKFLELAKFSFAQHSQRERIVATALKHPS